jgi:hypothetical protein
VAAQRRGPAQSAADPGACPPPLSPPPPPSRTKWTRLVHPSVLIGHAASLTAARRPPPAVIRGRRPAPWAPARASPGAVSRRRRRRGWAGEGPRVGLRRLSVGRGPGSHAAALAARPQHRRDGRGARPSGHRRRSSGHLRPGRVRAAAPLHRSLAACVQGPPPDATALLPAPSPADRLGQDHVLCDRRALRRRPRDPADASDDHGAQPLAARPALRRGCLPARARPPRSVVPHARVSHTSQRRALQMRPPARAGRQAVHQHGQRGDVGVRGQREARRRQARRQHRAHPPRDRHPGPPLGAAASVRGPLAGRGVSRGASRCVYALCRWATRRGTSIFRR